MIVASVHHFLTFWDIPSWAVAVGTLFLGGATVWLGTQARDEAGAVAKQADAVADQAKLSGDQLDLTRQQLEASQRPFVVPVTNDWNPLLFIPVKGVRPPAMGDTAGLWMMLSNAGAGPAYNVRGGLFWKGGIGGGWQLIPTSIPAGRNLPTPLEVHSGYDVKWGEAVGYLRYFDLAGTEWQTHFRYKHDTAGQYAVEVTAVDKTSVLGEPHYVSD